MKVAFDIDNVICDTVASARRVLAADLGMRTEGIELTHVYDQPFTHADPATAARLRIDHAFWERPEVLMGCEPLPGAIEALHRIARAGFLCGYVTRRPASVKSLTSAWLPLHGAPSAPIVHVGTNDPRTTYSRCKSDACRDLGATHLVDDHVTEIASARSAGIKVVIVDAEIGRFARSLMLARHSDVPLAVDLPHAVDILLHEMRKAA